jgi:hypothetical protein
MSIVALCTPAGSSGTTTTSVLLGAMAPANTAVIVAECDPSGGDIAAWAQLGIAPGWVTAVAASDRSWTGLLHHAQALPSGLQVLVAPARGTEARTTIAEAARGFAGLLTSMPDVIAFADCGRVGESAPVWASRAQLTVLLVRQSAQSAPATVAIVDRALEALDTLRGACPRVGVVLVGGEPYPAREIEAALGVPLFGALPDDRAGAGVVAGSWTLGRRAARSPLARAAATLSEQVAASLPAAVTAATTVADRDRSEDLLDMDGGPVGLADPVRSRIFSTPVPGTTSPDPAPLQRPEARP